MMRRKVTNQKAAGGAYFTPNAPTATQLQFFVFLFFFIVGTLSTPTWASLIAEQGNAIKTLRSDF